MNATRPARRLVVNLLIALTWTAGSVLAQQSVPVDREMTVDDKGPNEGDLWGKSGPPIEIQLWGALSVKVADVNGDGYGDVVLGGLGSDPCGPDVSVRVSYLDDEGDLDGDGTFDSWRIVQSEVIASSLVSGCYDLDVGDLNGDGRPDIVVGRRLGCSYVMPPTGGACNPARGQGLRDTVILNDGNTAAPNPGLFDELHVELPNPTASIDCGCDPNTNTGGDPSKNVGETFSVEIVDVDGSLPDILTAGNYGLRYYRNLGVTAGVPAFELAHVYCDDLDGTPTCNRGGTPYRSIALGDVTGDGRVDAVIARFEQEILVYRNRGVDLATNPFELLAGQPKIVQPASDPIGVESYSCVDHSLVSSTFGAPGAALTYGLQLGDLDQDGDLDLVCANKNARNAAFYNDGTGRFGSANTGIQAGNGQYALLFPPITPDYRSAHPSAISQAGANPGEYLARVVPGTAINSATDVSLFDVDLDGRLDVTFSNRNDMEEDIYAQCRCPGPLCPPPPPNSNCCLDSLGRTPEPLPDVYDFLFFNRTPASGALAFDTCVELLGLPNDGTGYGEFHQLNPNGGGELDEITDGRPEWFDANFSNKVPPQNGMNRVWWGAPLAMLTCNPPSGSSVAVHLNLSRDKSFKGSWSVLGAATCSWPPPLTTYLGFPRIPLCQGDCLWSYMLGSGSVSGFTTANNFDIQFTIPTSLACLGTDAAFCVIYKKATPGGGVQVVEVSNPVRVPLLPYVAPPFLPPEPPPEACPPPHQGG